MAAGVPQGTISILRASGCHPIAEPVRSYLKLRFRQWERARADLTVQVVLEPILFPKTRSHPTSVARRAFMPEICSGIGPAKL